MTTPSTPFEKFYIRLKNHPLVASLIVLSTIIIALSSLTDATKKLLALVIKEKRPAVNGEWRAKITYDWPNADYIETFTFIGDREEVQGIATFLARKRGILEGRVINDNIEFITKTQEVMEDWDKPKENTHHYQGKIYPNEIKFTMQTEGGYSTHVPIEFTARRVIDSTLEKLH